MGYRPYEALLQALAQVAPELAPTQHAEDEEKYKAYWGEGITEREVAEALLTKKQAQNAPEPGKPPVVAAYEGNKT
ncbi:hypothetical protein ABID22_002165 [Pontibacter aydingkolensis]|uniref:Uncharacterized protein n=1 Tax=Pontibacter aydingkolensis TaxID=1911536 RepID=A0ABS7CVE8_9BACT|nr:hypothetical protein [Pontibacter aydingkolensis]MBW7467775.1 hypothetical protein [Pontibacter aydingkolensis]